MSMDAKAICRFMSKVRVSSDGCWLWTAHRLPTGYGQFWYIDRKVYVHRWAYEHLGGGTLEAGLVIDHLCRVRECVNPDHLEQVTNFENSVVRAVGSNQETYRTGVCKRGHSMDDALVKPGGRRCRTCHNFQQRLDRIRRNANAVRSGTIRTRNPHTPTMGATVRLFHFTCEHGYEGIIDEGSVKPGVDGFVWMTDLAKPSRKALCLSSTMLQCDRMTHRFEVDPSSPGIISWLEYKQGLPPEVRRMWEDRLERVPQCRPSNWYVSRQRVPVLI